ncbi:MAG: type II secretion system F family protein [Planctomycetes bacterium]|nr:type II secretion system F family protein [Planctomycetota bacterium]
MPQYTYTAIDDDGKPVDGTLEAENEDELATNLSQMGYYLLTATTAKRGKKAKAKKGSKGGFYFGKVKQREIITFTHHLSTVLSAGIPILQGLEDLVEQTEDARFRNILAETRDDVKGGSSLSDAMAKHPEAFSELYVNLLKAGEASGEVDRVLAEIARFLEWQEEMTANVKQITIYPTVVFGAIVLLVGYLFAFVFPTFTKILTQLNVPLPLPTLIVISISNFMKNYWWLLLIGIAGVITTIKVILRYPWGRYAFDRFKLGIPIFGTLLRKIALSRFAHFMALLYSAGVDILESLTVVERVVGNEVIARVIRDAREQVKAGRRLSEPLRASKQFPPMVVRMVEIGEISGQLDKTLLKVSEFYDREIPQTVKKVFAAFEPIMIVFLAGIVLLVAVSMYLPLYSSLGTLGK